MAGRLGARPGEGRVSVARDLRPGVRRDTNTDRRSGSRRRRRPRRVVPLASKALFTDGRTLSGVLDRETYALVEAKADAAGLPMLVLERMKPWLAAMTLAVPALRRAGFDPALGVDRHFYDRAKAAGRPVRGLETVAYQIERLDGLPMPVQVEMLRAVLGDVDTQVAAVGEIVAAWTIGRRRRAGTPAAAGIPRVAGGLPAPARRAQPRLDRRRSPPAPTSRRPAWSSSAAPTWWAPTASSPCCARPGSASTSSSASRRRGFTAVRARSTSRPHEAALDVIVHQAHGLHERVDGGRPDEASSRGASGPSTAPWRSAWSAWPAAPPRSAAPAARLAGGSHDQA